MFSAEQTDRYMELAVEESRQCGADVPVGCVIVNTSGEVIARGRNTREQDNSVTGHAEINALNSAANATGSYKLPGCTVFVTLEPCPMCAGALRAANVDTIVFGAPNTSCGACGTVMNVTKGYVKTFGGVKKAEISRDLSVFFEKMRTKEAPRQ